MKKGSIMLASYIRKMKIDFFAFPVEMRNCVHIAIIAPDTLIQCIENDSPMLEKRKGELFNRVRRCYSPIRVMPEFRPIATFPTAYKKVKDFPIHAGMRARGFEIVVAETIGAKHTGDKMKDVDIVSTILGRIECKIGAGKLYWAAK